jgi:hypothetical protein
MPADRADDEAAFQDFQMGDLTLTEVVTAVHSGIRDRRIRSIARVYLPAEAYIYVPDRTRAAMEMVQAVAPSGTQVERATYFYDHNTYKQWGQLATGYSGFLPSIYYGSAEQ